MLARFHLSLSRCQTAALLLLWSLWVVISERPLWDSWEYVRVGDLVYGTAPRPYVARSFMPFLIRSVKSLIPSSLEPSINGFLNRYPILSAAHGWETMKIERTIFLVLNIIAFTLAAYGIRRLMRLSNLSERWSVIATVMTICSIPAYLMYITYIYDAPAIALFTWSLVFLAMESWPVYLVTFAICLWNKETGVFLALIFGLVYLQQIRSLNRKTLLLLTFQVVIAAGIAIWKSAAFSGNPGSILEWHLADRKTILFVYSIQTYVTILALIFLLAYRY